MLEVGYLLHTRPWGVLGVSERHSSDAYQHSDGTQWLNCIGDFRQSLAFLHVSHSPALYILVLAVQCLLHTRPPGVTVESVGLSLGAYRHSDSTQWLNCIEDFGQSLAFLHV